MVIFTTKHGHLAQDQTGSNIIYLEIGGINAQKIYKVTKTKFHSDLKFINIVQIKNQNEMLSNFSLTQKYV